VGQRCGIELAKAETEPVGSGSGRAGGEVVGVEVGFLTLAYSEEY
jgi:hypothetical protein